MDKEASNLDNSRSPKPASPTMFGWTANKAKLVGGACVQHLTGPAAGPILFACICLTVAYQNRRRLRRQPEQCNNKQQRILQRSFSLAALHGGDIAWQRIMDSAAVRIEGAAAKMAARRLEELLVQERIHFRQLQSEAAKLEMTGMEDEAAAILKAAWEKAVKVGKPQEAHEIEMLLVEMLIYQGKYQEALTHQCLYDKQVSDARAPLYKAVIYIIMNKKEEARGYFKEFHQIRGRFLQVPEYHTAESPVGGTMHDFDKFVEIVEVLKKEVDHADVHKRNISMTRSSA